MIGAERADRVADSAGGGSWRSFVLILSDSRFCQTPGQGLGHHPLVPPSVPCPRLTSRAPRNPRHLGGQAPLQTSQP